MKKTKLPTILISATLGVVLSSNAGAALIASYADGAATDAAAFTNTTSAPLIASVSNLSSVGLNGLLTSTQSGGDSGVTGTTLPGDPANNYIYAEANETGATSSTTDYFGLTLTYNAAQPAPLNLSFDAINGAAGRAGGLSTTYSIFYDLNNSGTFALAAPAQTLTWDGVTPSNTLSNPQSFSFDLSNIAALTSGDTVELRLNLEDSSGLNQKNSFLKNVNLQTIPEPSVAILGCLGMLALLRRRK